MARMVATRQGHQIRFEVRNEPVTLGRSSHCTVRLPDPNISRQHCRLEFVGGELRASDLDSQNGMLWDGERVSDRTLRVGDTIRIGDTYIRYESEERGLAPSHALVGSTLDGYRILELIGRGGYASVYRAEQVNLHRQVALKVLDPEGTSNTTEAVAAFEREARAAAALNHQNLVHVHDIGEADGRHYLSMELVAGGNLATAIKAEGRLPVERSLAILADITEALDCAHGHGLVHRDVKPANILLAADGRAKLADLGLALEVRHAGTAAFMAPEQILRRPVDARSDLYSLGCTAFSMLAGAPPFAQLHGKERLIAHVKTVAPTLASIGVEVPVAVEELVARLLAKNPDDRPQSAAELRDELAAIRSPSAGQLLPGSRSRRARLRRQRQSSSAAAALWLGLLTLVIAGVGYLLWRRFGS